MKERIQNNFGLKLLSLVIAFVLWIVIINAIDPSDSKSVSYIPVELLHEESLTDLGYTFDVLEGENVSITVKGPKSILDGLVASDFYACADLSTISQWSEYVYVDIDVKCIKNVVGINNVSIALRNQSVKIGIENRDTRTMNVDVVLSGTPAEGYVIGEYDVSPISIKVTGAASAVDQIAKVVAEYDIEGTSLDMTEVVNLKLYDEEDNEIDASNIILSKNTAKLRIPVLVKKTIPVNYAYKGSPKEGYKVAGLEGSVKEIVIAGSASAVAAINEVDIPAELIDISDVAGTKEYTVRISHYVPSTVKIISESVSTVVADVEPLITRDFTIPTSQIILENKAASLNYSFLRNSFNATFTGVAMDIEKIVAANVTATADVSGLVEGNYVVKLTIQNVNNCTAVGEYTVTVNVK